MFNTAKVHENATVAVFGIGAVGLAVIEGVLQLLQMLVLILIMYMYIYRICFEFALSRLEIGALFECFSAMRY